MTPRGLPWSVTLERVARFASADAQMPPIEAPPVGSDTGTQPAAVIVPLVRDGDRTQLLLTRRAAHLKRHPGQVSFPGGRMHAGDATRLETALRETWEELGIPPAHLEVAGRLSECVTGTGFSVTPFVALAARLPALTPDPGEVGEVFMLPLDPGHILGAFRREHLDTGAGRREFWVLDHDGHRIWGATARMLRELVQRLADER